MDFLLSRRVNRRFDDDKLSHLMSYWVLILFYFILQNPFCYFHLLTKTKKKVRKGKEKVKTKKQNSDPSQVERKHLGVK